MKWETTKKKWSSLRCSLLRSVTWNLFTGSAVLPYGSLTKKGSEIPGTGIFLHREFEGQRSRIACGFMAKRFVLFSGIVWFGRCSIVSKLLVKKSNLCEWCNGAGTLRRVTGTWSTSRLCVLIRIWKLLYWSLNLYSQDGWNERSAIIKQVIKSCGRVRRSWHLSGLHHFLRFFLKLEMQNEACRLRPDSEAMGHFGWIKRICHSGLEQQSALNRSESICSDDGWRAAKSPGKILLAVLHPIEFQYSSSLTFFFFFCRSVICTHWTSWNVVGLHFLNVFHGCLEFHYWKLLGRLQPFSI